MIKNNIIKKTGFTLIELIIYIAIATIILIFVITTGQNLAFSNIKAKAQVETTYYGRLVMQTLSEKTRNAENVKLGSSIFTTHPGKITLDYPGASTDVIFDTYTKILPGNITIRKLRMQDGASSYVDLTSDQVNVTNFVVRNLTKAAEPKNINFELSLEFVNPSNDPKFGASISVETSISLRK